MRAIQKLILVLSLVLLVTSCKTFDTADDAPQNTEDLAALDNTPSGDSSLEADLSDSASKPATQEASPDAATEAPKGGDDFAQFDEPAATPPPAAAPAPAPEPPPPVVEQAPPPPPPEAPAEATPPPPAEAAPVAQNSNLVNIKAIQFKGNDNGGTVVVEADGPLTYSTRMNASSGQFVVDIPNSMLPQRLTRPLVTKDFEGSIGSVDAYESSGSNVTRIVVHLKTGASEPVVQVEGSALLIVASEMPKDAPPDENTVKLLNYASLEDFMAGNMAFGGKKISIETDEIEMHDLFKLISEEGGVNLVIADDVSGKMSVKLRQVPWDQALVMIMKAKKLSYTRSGNILRIVPMSELKKEEDDAVAVAASRQTVSPLIIKLVPISYAKPDELSKQLTPFLSKRGNVVADLRTSSVVISDVEETVDRILKLIQSIDIPPQQVLIEGKIVEAQETFQRQIGVSWNATGLPQQVGSSNSGNTFATISPTVTPGTVSAPTGSLNFSLGVLDILGNLNAILTLQEQEGNVKVLSSPRVVAMHNEPAEISQTTEIPLITSQPTQLGASIPQVSFKPVKLDLKVTPSVTNDGGVIMKVDVLREFPGQIVNLQTNAQPINGRSASTKVLVHNGQTAVIGGIYQNDTQDTEYRVPWLGSVPVIGWLFKGTNHQTTKNELLVFITPRILGRIDSQTVQNGEGGGSL